MNKEKLLNESKTNRTANDQGVDLKRFVIRSFKGRFLPYDERAWNAEPGDKMVDAFGVLCRLEESSGRGKKSLGELYARVIQPPSPKYKAQIINEIGYWILDV